MGRLATRNPQSVDTPPPTPQLTQYSYPDVSVCSNLKVISPHNLTGVALLRGVDVVLEEVCYCESGL